MFLLEKWSLIHKISVWKPPVLYCECFAHICLQRAESFDK